MKVLQYFEKIKYQTLAETFVNFFDANQEEYSSQQQDQLQKKFVDNFNKTSITKEDVMSFIERFKLPQSLFARWNVIIKARLDDAIRNYMKWLPTEKRIELDEQMLNNQDAIIEFLERQPDFLEYLNFEINSKKATK